MYDQIAGFTDKEIETIWKNLDFEGEYMPGVSMEDWAVAIYSEMSKRNLGIFDYGKELLDHNNETERCEYCSCEFPNLDDLVEHYETCRAQRKTEET